eukprot:409160-Pleurochrysis_carterae.AAC.2
MSTKQLAKRRKQPPDERQHAISLLMNVQPRKTRTTQRIGAAQPAQRKAWAQRQLAVRESPVRFERGGRLRQGVAQEQEHRHVHARRSRRQKAAAAHTEQLGEGRAEHSGTRGVGAAVVPFVGAADPFRVCLQQTDAE